MARGATSREVRYDSCCPILAAMTATFNPQRQDRQWTGVALTLALHAMMLLAWRHAGKLPAPDASPREAIQWVDIAIARPAPPPVRPPPPAVPAAPRPSPAPAKTASPAPAAAPVPSVQPLPPPGAETPPALSAHELLQQARRSVGKIDQDLRKAYPGQPITAPVDNGHTRMAKKMQDAADMVPNKWYEAPKVTEILDPGPYGRRRYRVVGALGTYCITVESNHAPDGIDQMQKGIQQKITTCDEDEQAPTRQKYK